MWSEDTKRERVPVACGEGQGSMPHARWRKRFGWPAGPSQRKFQARALYARGGSDAQGPAGTGPGDQGAGPGGQPAHAPKGRLNRGSELNPGGARPGKAPAGAYRHLGMAGYSASAMDLFRAHDNSPSRVSAKTEFGRCGACARGSHNGPYCLGLRCDGVFDLLPYLYAA
jgi:hypothetical protein